MKTALSILATMTLLMTSSLSTAATPKSKESRTQLCVSALNSIYDLLGDGKRFTYQSPQLVMLDGNTSTLYEYYEGETAAAEIEVNKDLGIETIDMGIEQAINGAIELYIKKREALTENLHTAAAMTADIVKSDFATQCGAFPAAHAGIAKLQEKMSTIPHKEYLVSQPSVDLQAKSQL